MRELCFWPTTRDRGPFWFYLGSTNTQQNVLFSGECSTKFAFCFCEREIHSWVMFPVDFCHLIVFSFDFVPKILLGSAVRK